MNYLLFNDEIFLSDGASVHRINKDDRHILEAIDQANICVVDVDVLITGAVEMPVEKKDSILVRKFKGLYQHEAYIIQDERIDHNLFQVIGIKEQKVREIYSLIPSQKVEALIPYGIALRNALLGQHIDLNKTVVFVDDQAETRLLTVFDGLKFSRTRVIANNGEDILPEIKRSQIDFFKKNEEYLNKNTNFVIIVNNQSLAFDISKNEEKIPVECLNLAYPALEGLKEINTQIEYRLPEEILKKRKEIELKKNVTTMALSLMVVTTGLLYMLFNKIEREVVQHHYDLADQTNTQLNEHLRILDQETYREDLKAHQSLNYGIAYLEVLNLVPASYQVDSFKFIKRDSWNLELSLSAGNEGSYDPIPKIRILKNADIKDTFVNNQPAKHLRIIL